jgi:predicted dehydrogenase
MPSQNGHTRGGHPVGIGVVGLGYWGPNLVRNLVELPSADIRWLCDVDPPALEKIAERWPDLPRTRSYHDVLADPDVEAIAIATPVSTHAGLAGLGLEAGKHVFVEKPLATSSGDASALIDSARVAGLVLMPGHTFLYSPAVRFVRDMIRDGELGDIYFVSMSRLNLGQHRPDVSVVWDLAPHDVAILRFWLGEMPTYVSGIGRDCVMDQSDVAFLHLEFPSGTLANIEVAWLAPTKLRRTVIVGSRRMILYDDTSRDPVRVFDAGIDLPDPQTFGEYQLSYRTGDVISPPIPIAEPLFLELADFCGAIRDGRAPLADAELGLEVVRVVEAADRSLASGWKLRAAGCLPTAGAPDVVASSGARDGR